MIMYTSYKLETAQRISFWSTCPLGNCVTKHMQKKVAYRMASGYRWSCIMADGGRLLCTMAGEAGCVAPWYGGAGGRASWQVVVCHVAGSPNKALESWRGARESLAPVRLLRRSIGQALVRKCFLSNRRWINMDTYFNCACFSD